jgi:hypothetical protein
MKKRLILTGILFALSFLKLSAENLQIVMPKLVYIGDSLEIRYIFHSDAILFSGDFADNISAKLELRTDHDFFRAQDQNFTVKAASLEKINSEYTLSLSVIPWKTGLLSVPPFNLSSIVDYSQKDGAWGKRSVPFVINLSPVEVKSLVTKTGNKTFMKESGPLVLPGTTLLLVIFSVISIVLFTGFMSVLLRLPKVARFIENLTYIYSLKRISRKAVKSILSLQKDSKKIESDKDFARRLQHILRDFIGKRFAHDFSSTATSRIYGAFEELCAGELSRHQADSVEELCGIFSRLDYIRFAENASFLSASQNSQKSERDSVCEKSISLIRDFDSEEEEE